MRDYPRNGFAVSTAKGHLIASTAGCTFLGISAYASAACTLTVVDSGKTLLGPIVMSALEHLPIMMPLPIVCTSGLSATNSGGGYYTVFYGKI